MKAMRLSVLLVAVLALAAVAAASDVPTVGGFVQRLALAKGLEADDARTAVDSLAGAGVRLPEGLDLEAGLTEGDVARMARAIGLDVGTHRPDTPFSAMQVERFFESRRVEEVLSSGPPQDGPEALPRTSRFDPRERSAGSGRKGKKKGRTSVPNEPE